MGLFEREECYLELCDKIRYNKLAQVLGTVEKGGLEEFSAFLVEWSRQAKTYKQELY